MPAQSHQFDHKTCNFSSSLVFFSGFSLCRCKESTVLVCFALACCRPTLCALQSAVFNSSCPETFPPHCGAAVQFKQGRFQDVSLREKTEIPLKADSFCSVPLTPNMYTWETSVYCSLPGGFAHGMFTLVGVLHLSSY